MEIISLPFALLSVVSIFLFYLINQKFRTWYLILLSCGFIANFSYYLLAYILAYSLINYFIGRSLPVSRFKKTLFRTGIVVNISQLIILKYASFAIDPIFRIFNLDFSFSIYSEIIVPIGISYFTLQGIGYLVNIKMGWEKPEKKPQDFLLYIVFYPKFLSGPIDRSNHFIPQLKVIKSFDEKQVTEGLRIALFGFFKKVVIANQLGAVVMGAYSNLPSTGGLNLWIVLLVQPLYLYFDFSGYTDIAIGFAKTYGIQLLPNFNRPFLAENISTFWKRFHMSLSLWFNDYIFKQLCFRYRRWGKNAAVFAVFATFTLFGIWHGAGWNFMVLGLLQALAINFEFFTKKQRTNLFSKMPDFWRILMGRVITYLFYGFSLIFFFSEDLNSSMRYLAGLNNFETGLNLDTSSEMFFLALIFAAVLLIFEYLIQDYNNVFCAIEKYWNSHRKLRFMVYYLITILILFNLGEKITFIYEMF